MWVRWWVWKIWGSEGIQLFDWKRLAGCELFSGVRVSGRSFDLRICVP